MQPDLDTIKVIEEIDAKVENSDLIRLSTGVVLRGQKVSSTLLIEVTASSTRPKPPTFFNKQMGREMENLDDPDYIERVQAYKYKMAGSMVTIMILKGTQIVSVPTGMEGPDLVKKKKRGKDSTEEFEWPQWLVEYELLDLPMRPENPHWRYLTWVKAVAAPADEDLKLIQEVVGRLSGIRNADVEAAEDFPGNNKKNR